MTKNEAVRRYRNWVVKHSLGINLVWIIVYTLVVCLVATWVFRARSGDYVPADPFQEGLALGGLLVVGVMGVIIHVLARRLLNNVAPMPVIPDNQPTRGVFVWDPEDPEVPEARCYCHNLPIVNGQEVINWPQLPKYICVDRVGR
ncbi:hypothetical protein [Streptomyces sp. NPDC088727]|uniref:hypothetical protein n=1 Tax=Streptomyces sp. NPDC088727 TaxID=3365875 RepID=UPI003802A5D2